jgi:CheY-like chemotaxis protein
MSWGLRIVIVEDDALIGRYLDDLLSGMGHDVRAIARTEPDAVEAASEHHPDLMIVDGNLRDGSGVSAMRQILSKGFIRHFYVTGNALAMTQVAGDAMIITKPFNLRDLQSAIAKTMQANPN